MTKKSTVLIALSVSLSFLVACSESRNNETAVTCVPESEMNGIVGGYRVSSSDELSKKVVLLMINKDSKTSLCTGTPISKDVILTAAHCVSGVKDSDVRVIYHTDVTCESGFNINEKSVSSSDIVVHSGYVSQSASAKDDIALVKVSSPIPNDYSVSPILRDSEEKPSDYITLVGYGLKGETSGGAGFLRTIQKSSEQIYTTEKNIVISQRDGRGVCRGDSGGPVFYQINGTLVVAGINSIGIGETESTICRGQSVAMYLPYYADWVDTQLGNLGSR